jgi:hypothetical protein
MNEYILFMYHDVKDVDIANDSERWAKYMATLGASGQFDGGSSIGAGVRFKAGHEILPADTHISGYIRIRAASPEAAACFLEGNPVFEAGGTVEVRELPKG